MPRAYGFKASKRYELQVSGKGLSSRDHERHSEHSNLQHKTYIINAGAIRPVTIAASFNHQFVTPTPVVSLSLYSTTIHVMIIVGNLIE